MSQQASQLYQKFIFEQNKFTMNKLMGIKREYSMLKNELSNIKAENERLHSALIENFNNPSNIYRVNQYQQDSMNSSNSFNHTLDRANFNTNPLVVFNFNNSKVSVVSVNSEFCNMFKYSMNEALSMSWTDFIHPDYIGRTREILSNSKTNSVSFKQCYIDKLGNTFKAHDNHTLIFDNNGHIQYDTVQIIPIYSDVNVENMDDSITFGNQYDIWNEPFF